MLTTVNEGVKVPDRYNGDLLDTNYAFNLDYLIFNLRGNPILDTSNDLLVNVAEYGTKVFKHRAEIKYKGEIFGTIVYRPRSTVLDKDLVQMQLQNHLFYTKSPNELREITENVIKLLNLEYDGLNRADLALDFMGNQHDIPNFLKGIFDGKFLIAGREKDVNVYTKTKKGRIDFTGIQIGKRSSSRFCRIYNKSVEMQRGTLKPYITTMWEKLNLSGEIWRYEYQLSNKFLREIEDLTLENIFDKNFLFGLMEMARKNHFEVKNNTGKSELNKEKNHNFIDFDKVRENIKASAKAVGRLVRNIKETFIGQQRMVKGLLRSYFSSGHDIRFLLPIRRILNDFNLWDWYNRKFSDYLREFRDKEKIIYMDYYQYEKDFKLEC